MEALKPVDAAILGYEKMDLRKVIEKVKPRIIAVGHDQTDIFRSLKRLTCEKNMKFRVVQIGRFGRANLNSSSKIKRKVIEEWRS